MFSKGGILVSFSSIIIQHLEETLSKMASSSSSSEIASSKSSPISLSSTLSLPHFCQKHVASKIENLVEYSYIPESAQINES